MLDLLSVPPQRRESIERLAQELRAGRSVAISTHINADGDGCGSETALARLLGQLGIRAQIVNPTPWPDMYKFMLGDDVHDASDRGAKALKEADVLVVLDISDVKRLGVLAEAVRKLTIPKLVIDHHLPSDEPPSTLLLADTAACATGELIYDFAMCLGLEITPDIARGLYVLTDPLALDVVVRNLLENAIAAITPVGGGSITFVARRTQSEIELAVKDSGVGFRPVDGLKLFEKFTRLHPGGGSSYYGTGLGLFIVRRLMQLAGGRVSAHSEGVGQGAQFILTWPVAPAEQS